MKKRFLFMLFFLFFLMGIAWSQTGTVKGTVTSGEDGLPVVGASVLVKGTTIGTITDVDGRFSIQNLPASAPTIVVSFVGMKSQELPVSQEEMEIVLNPDAETLDEVVVTAQGLSRKEKSLGYSTQKVGGEQLTTVRQTDLGNAMAGKIAGARFYGSSGSTFDSGSIVLRGTNSFTSPQGSEPIYVVDGSITNKNSVNMDDVESINVLKGLAATALYGSEGGNGAVIITTKRAQEGKGRIEVSHTLQWERYYNHFDMQKQYGGGSLGYNGEVFDAQYGEEYDTMSAQYLYGIFRNQQNSGAERQFLAVKTSFQPIEWMNVSLDYKFTYRRNRNAASFDFMIGGQMVSWTNLWSTGSGTSIATARLNNRGVNEREGINRGGGVYVTGVDETTGEKVSTIPSARIIIRMFLLTVGCIMSEIRTMRRPIRIEAWSDWRRYNIPELPIEPGQADVGITVYPYRMQYSDADKQYNVANAEAAIRTYLNGDDSRWQRVWWDVADND